MPMPMPILSDAERRHMRAQLYLRLRGVWPIGGMTDASDLAQEAAIAVWHAEQAYTRQGVTAPPGPWCHVVARRRLIEVWRNLCGREARQRRGRAARDNPGPLLNRRGEALLIEDPHGTDALARVETRIDARAAAARVGELPPVLARTIRRRYGDGWGLRAIGAEDGISESGAKLRLDRALARLREMVA